MSHNILNTEMKAFISAIFGNDGWVKLVEARWLRIKQHRRAAEYDPNEKEQVPIYVKANYKYGNQQIKVPRQIVDELPTSSADQFGDFHKRSGIGEP